MKTQIERKFCFNCKHFMKHYKKIKAGLQVADFGECGKVPLICGEVVNLEYTCYKWEEIEKTDIYDKQSVINEISEIMCRLKAVLYEIENK